jgi:hypothetical protein
VCPSIYESETKRLFHFFLFSSTTSRKYLSKRAVAGLFMIARHEIVQSPSEAGVRYHAR